MLERSAAAPEKRLPQAGFVVATAMILGVVVFLTTGGESEPLKPIVIATGEWAPYSGESLPEQGIASAIVTTTLRRAGYEPTFRFMQWPVAENTARANDANAGVRATFPYILTSERESDFYYSDPILEIGQSVFYNAQRNPEAARIRAAEDLGRFEILAIKGYKYPIAIQKMMDTTNAVATNDSAFVHLLRSNRPVVVVEATRVGQELLRGRFAAYDDIIKAVPLDPIRIYFIASRSNPNNLPLIRDFNAALKSISKSGIEEIESSVTTAIDMERVVMLQPFEPAASIRAYDNATGPTSVLLPNGTRAVVERWSRRYLLPNAQLDGDMERVQVRILNGPQQGKLFFVDPRTVVLP
jgi:polar amino acid transport system substrate-binding protein